MQDFSSLPSLTVHILISWAFDSAEIGTLHPTIQNWLEARQDEGFLYREPQILYADAKPISSPSHNCLTQCGYPNLWNQSKNTNLKSFFPPVPLWWLPRFFFNKQTSLLRESYISSRPHCFLCTASDSSALFLKETSWHWQAAGEEGHSSLFSYPPWFLAAEEARWSDSLLIWLCSLEIAILGLLGIKKKRR